MTRLSVVIITYNEEKNIERCLDSVKDIADDIIVVDSFSTDKTQQICLSKGVCFIKHKFEGYIEQKNFANAQAKYQHILSLDADEAISNELRKSILSVKNNWLYDGYTMNRFTNYCGKWIKHCGWYPDKKLRLFDKTKGKWTGLKIHEKVELMPKSAISFLKGDILHYSYYTIASHIAQANKFSDISAKILFSKNKKTSIFKIIFSPVIKFLCDYFLKLGFLDGFYGFVICKISAHANFLKYCKLIQFRRTKKHDKV